MKAIERFYQYIEYKRIRPTRFEKDFSLSNGYLGTQLRRKGNLGEEIMNNIINSCPDLNPLWLLLGDGEMLKTEKNQNLDILNEPAATAYETDYKALAEERKAIIKEQKKEIKKLTLTIERLKYKMNKKS